MGFPSLQTSDLQLENNYCSVFDTNMCYIQEVYKCTCTLHNLLLTRSPQCVLQVEYLKRLTVCMYLHIVGTEVYSEPPVIERRPFVL
jgi:hypothetical protein